MYISGYGISFGSYKSVLKTLFKEGSMPSVTRGIYGDLINNANVTLEHLKPHSQGGGTSLSNMALASFNQNCARSSEPLGKHLTMEMVESYLSQFNFNITGKFDGESYQKAIRETCKKLGVV